jgi:uncharacterized protein YyaL (SSP411 family)
MENKELGGFYSAEDADSEGEEGKFYVWTKREIHDALTPEALTSFIALSSVQCDRSNSQPLSLTLTHTVQEAERFCEVYNVTERGNFEHRTTHLNLLNQKVCSQLVVL